MERKGLEVELKQAKSDVSDLREEVARLKDELDAKNAEREKIAESKIKEMEELNKRTDYLTVTSNVFENVLNLKKSVSL